eukprot:6482604-Amphidinium_carterae.2
MVCCSTSYEMFITGADVREQLLTIPRAPQVLPEHMVALIEVNKLGPGDLPSAGIAFAALSGAMSDDTPGERATATLGYRLCSHPRSLGQCRSCPANLPTSRLSHSAHAHQRMKKELKP